MGELVVRRDMEGIAILSLNRPERLNALSMELFEDLRRHIDEIAADTENVGVVILRGEGRAFSAGADLAEVRSGNRPPGYFKAETVVALEQLPQPVIAAVHGHCYTGALELVLGCDLLVAAESARFADTHGKWAITPTWGMSQRLPRRIGPLRAKEMMFTGVPVDGRRAVEIGLANLCVPDDELESATEELARTIVANSWHTLRADKMLVTQGQNFTLAEGLEFERRASPGRGSDMAERLKAFGSKSG